ncbi:MAG: LapA family protein [bacterium]
MRFLGLIFVIIVIGFMVGFMVLNSQSRVDLDIFGQRVFDISLAMVCFYAFVAGMVFVLVFALADEILLRTNLFRMNKENKNLKKELEALRNLPLEEEK